MGDLFRRMDLSRAGFPIRLGERSFQYGAVQVLLSRQSLVGALRTPLPTLADQLGLRVERSFNEQYGCEFAYFETDRDNYTVVHWEPSEAVEVWAALAPSNHRASVDFPVGAEEFRRFLELVGAPSEEIIIPRGLRSESPDR